MLFIPSHDDFIENISKRFDQDKPFLGGKNKVLNDYINEIAYTLGKIVFDKCVIAFKNYQFEEVIDHFEALLGTEPNIGGLSVHLVDDVDDMYSYIKFEILYMDSLFLLGEFDKVVNYCLNSIKDEIAETIIPFSAAYPDNDFIETSPDRVVETCWELKLKIDILVERLRGYINFSNRKIVVQYELPEKEEISLLRALLIQIQNNELLEHIQRLLEIKDDKKSFVRECRDVNELIVDMILKSKGKSKDPMYTNLDSGIAIINDKRNLLIPKEMINSLYALKNEPNIDSHYNTQGKYKEKEYLDMRYNLCLIHLHRLIKWFINESGLNK